MGVDAGISVIITTYNAPEYLRRVLEGYRHQTRLPDEIIIADDGSTSETMRVVKQFQAVAPFSVHHVWHEDQGFRAAKIRNEAVKVSNGSYLIFTDGDCLPQRFFVEDHLGLARDGWFVQGKRMLVGERLKDVFDVGDVSGHWRACLRGDLRGCHHLLRIPRVIVRSDGLRGIKTCNLALHRDAVLAINGFNEAFIGWGREDAEFAARLYAFGMKRKDPLFSALVFHLWHPENSRGNLLENDRMLSEVLRNGVAWTPYGILQKDTAVGNGTPA